MNLKNQIEALLFLTDEPIHAQVIAERVNVDINEVRQALSQLMQDYEARDCGLCIESYDGYILNVKPQYDTLVEEFLPLDIKTGCLRTLSAIALKEPVSQADLVKMRGGGAYEQIKELLEMELIARKRENGHSFVLKTTKLFHDYFKLSGSGIELQDFLKGKSRRFKQPEQETFDLSSTEEDNELKEVANQIAANVEELETTEEPSSEIQIEEVKEYDSSSENTEASEILEITAN